MPWLFFSCNKFWQADKQNADAAAGLSAELFSMLTDEGDKPDDASVMKKIEELEV